MKLGGTWRRVDVLILVVAAAAVVMQNDRETSKEFDQSWVNAFAGRWNPAIRKFVGPTLRIASGFTAALIVVSAGLGVASLRRPFVLPGRKWPGRGVTAIAVAGSMVFIGLASIVPEAITAPTASYLALSNPHFLSITLMNCGGLPQDAILGSWLLLAFAGRWRSEPDAFERAGRVLGWCWLTSIVLDLARSSLW